MVLMILKIWSRILGSSLKYLEPDKSSTIEKISVMLFKSKVEGGRSNLTIKFSSSSDLVRSLVSVVLILAKIFRRQSFVMVFTSVYYPGPMFRRYFNWINMWRTISRCHEKSFHRRLNPRMFGSRSRIEYEKRNLNMSCSSLILKKYLSVIVRLWFMVKNFFITSFVWRLICFISDIVSSLILQNTVLN